MFVVIDFDVLEREERFGSTRQENGGGGASVKMYVAAQDLKEEKQKEAAQEEGLRPPLFLRERLRPSGWRGIAPVLTTFASSYKPALVAIELLSFGFQETQLLKEDFADFSHFGFNLFQNIDILLHTWLDVH